MTKGSSTDFDDFAGACLCFVEVASSGEVIFPAFHLHEKVFTDILSLFAKTLKTVYRTPDRKTST